MNWEIGEKEWTSKDDGGNIFGKQLLGHELHLPWPSKKKTLSSRIAMPPKSSKLRS